MLEADLSVVVADECEEVAHDGISPLSNRLQWRCDKNASIQNHQHHASVGR